MRICQTIGLILLLFFALTPCRAQYEQPQKLRLPPSFVLKMSPDQWEDYCMKRDGWNKAALDYYEKCAARENQRRARRFPRSTQRQWQRMKHEINLWFNARFNWYQVTSDAGTIAFLVYLKENIYREQCLTRVLKGYTRPQQNRHRCRKRLRAALEMAYEGVPESSEDDSNSIPLARKKDIRAVVTALRQANRRLRRFALLKSSNTMRAIADGVEKMMSDEAN